MPELNAWVVDDDASIRWVLERALTSAAMNVTCFSGGIEMLEALDDATPDVLVTDIRMPGISGLELLARVSQRAPALPTIIITAYSDLESAVSSYQSGAFEYLPKPFDTDEVVAMVQRAARPVGPKEDPTPSDSIKSQMIIGEAPAMQEIFRAIGRLSVSEITTLITGESGTGKERVAEALHQNSPRAAESFIAVNTAAIPAELMESEFFGHEKGAFTGAVAQRRGRFEQAHKGTLFLDEIGDMPAGLQTRLLRVLQDGTFYRVGGHQAVTVDVRVVAATNQDLEQAVSEGRFRDDLYHRLNVIRLRVPPLRERRSDIGALLDFFLGRAAEELKTQPKALADEARQELENCEWPGNVRQLENTCRWLTVMAPGTEITAGDLPAELRSGTIGDKDAPSPSATGVHSRLDEASTPADSNHASSSADVTPEAWDTALARWAEQRLAEGADHLMDETIASVERVMIDAALAQSGGHRQKAAHLLGWGRNTLTRKIKEHRRSGV